MGQRPLLMLAQDLQREGAEGGDIQPVEAIEQGLQGEAPPIRLAIAQLGEPFCVASQFPEKRLAAEPALGGILLEGRVDGIQTGRLLAFDAQEVTDQLADGLLGVAFDGSPIFGVETLLVAGGEIHEQVIAHLVAFGEREAGGIEALEDELRVVLVLKGDAQDLQFPDGRVKLGGGEVGTAQPLGEKVAVLQKVGGWQGRPADSQKIQPRGLIVGAKSQTRGLLKGLELVDERVFRDLICQLWFVGRRRQNTLPQKVAEGQEKQGDRGEALLAIDDDTFGEVAALIVFQHHAPKEMGRAVVSEHSLEVVKQLGALLDRPAVGALIDRNDVLAPRVIEKLDERVGGALHGGEA